MTTQDLKNNETAIIAKYYELTGIESMLKEFIVTLNQAVDFGLNETEDYLELVSQFFNARYEGKKQKVTLADSLAKFADRQEKDSMKWNPVTREWN